MHILPNILWSENNPTMTFGQLIQYKVRNIFLKNDTQYVAGKLFPEHFLEDQNWAYLWINNLKLHKICFDWILSWVLSKYIETKLQTTCFYFT